MGLPESYLAMNDVVCKMLEMPDGAKLLEDAAAEVRRQSEIEAPLIRESARRSMSDRLDRMIAEFERIVEVK